MDEKTEKKPVEMKDVVNIGVSPEKQQDLLVLQELSQHHQQSQLNTQDSETHDKAMVKTVKILSENERIKAMSELNSSDADWFATMYGFSDLTKNDHMKKYLDTTLELRISLGRKGRLEFSEIARSLATDHIEQKGGGIMNWLKGK